MLIFFYWCNKKKQKTKNKKYYFCFKKRIYNIKKKIMGGCCSTDTGDISFSNMQRKPLPDLPLHPKMRSQDSYVPTTTKPLHDKEMQELRSSSVNRIHQQSNLRTSKLDNSKSAPSSPVGKKKKKHAMMKRAGDDDSDIEDLYGPSKEETIDNNNENSNNNLQNLEFSQTREMTPGAETHLSLINVHADTEEEQGHGQSGANAGAIESDTIKHDGNIELVLADVYETPEGVLPTGGNVANAGDDQDDVITDESSLDEDREQGDTVPGFMGHKKQLMRDLHTVDNNKRLSLHDKQVQKNLLRQKSMWKWSQDQINENEEDMRQELWALQTLGIYVYIYIYMYIYAYVYMCIMLCHEKINKVPIQITRPIVAPHI
ncbi:hypothetical protein RFI_05089 [Reticulomyxa filosa]|uniref:Uncharacterized protein n=1 Tax=Reticulomyxa filosa TaxID=46433 RepID=X6P385_RETFI|nr:hypothetical protein RFI_05089 [Reticulomyxa filosa]|eukprot:ETO32027.1 hypothetical protein RFI_05089 [Reticulomyxa filosa]